MNRKFVLLHVLLALLLGVQACALPGGDDGGDVAPTDVPIEVEATNTPVPPIVHTLLPTAGNAAVASAHDNEESETYEERTIRGGDDFRINRFERPFTSEAMEYLPHLDIKDFSMTQNADFYFVQIQLVGVDPATGAANGTYGAEFDLDSDGRAEMLVLASTPLGADWTTDGVSVHIDTNGDVGGATIYPDEIYTGNGFDAVIFNAGQGTDPDLAWAHFVNTSSPVVELAFKKSLLAKPIFMWSVLASADPVDPTRFYYNDTFTLAAAGSPIKGENYPVKALAAYDNSCRVPAGFTATGNEPLGCQVSHERPEYGSSVCTPIWACINWDIFDIPDFDFP